jgi:putative DNA methylase
MTCRKKLIEVALPLEAINKESAREKSIRHGHPSTLHLWWARRPLAACRAVLFASLVDDPGEYLEEDAAEQERRRLFALIEDLVKWENINNEEVINKARLEIAKSVARQKGMELPVDMEPGVVNAFLAEHAPPVMDPFAGGGSIPLEAQRLGLKAYAGDLNPVAVLINKALIEIPPGFANLPPVNPESRKKIGGTENWRGAAGLAEDIRYYGRLVRDMAYKKIGHLYPRVQLPQEHGGGEASVIAWLWARTVKCPNPACGAQMPLARSFWLSKKKGKEAWVEPVVDKTVSPPEVNFEVRTGKGKALEGTVNRRGAVCLCCGTPVPFDHIRAEGRAGRMQAQLMAVVVEGRNGRVYLQPTEEHVAIASGAVPEWQPEAALPQNPRDFKTPNYGMNTFANLFTPRQLVTLTTFSELTGRIREIVAEDALSAGLAGDNIPLNRGGTGARAYAEAVAVYLALSVDKLADRGSSICSWDVSRDNIRNTFARQAIPMNWDYAEGNPFSDSTGNWLACVNWAVEAVANAPAGGGGSAHQADATSFFGEVSQPLFSTDPPYYDNIGYADLADFFYVWLRQNLKDIYPGLFRTMLTPKNEELVATPYRFGGSKDKAKEHFERGLQKTFQQMCQKANPGYPVTVYYAFKQAENDNTSADKENGGQMVSSTGWETMLTGLVSSGFQITGTWPMRTELSNRPVASGTNALASSIVLVCRPRPAGAPVTTRRELLSALKKHLPKALKSLQKSNIAPVDLAQAAIGPGMAVFSSYSKVLEADGSPMTVRTALALVNQVLDEYLAEQEGEYDADTRWALAWFEQYGMKEGPFGDAETLSKAKNTSVNGLVLAGILNARGGKVKLLSRDEYPGDWDPAADDRPTVWEAVQHMIIALEKSGEEAAARLLKKLGPMAEAARDLSYRLFNICERKGWAGEALAYNGLVVAWPRLLELAAQMPGELEQRQLF